MVKIHDEKEIYKRYNAGESVEKLGVEFSTSYQTIRRIVEKQSMLAFIDEARGEKNGRTNEKPIAPIVDDAKNESETSVDDNKVIVGKQEIPTRKQDARVDSRPIERVNILFDRGETMEKQELTKDDVVKTEKPADVDTYFCGNCEKEITRGAKVCPHCGAELNDVEY